LPKKFTAISLFSGALGLDIGLDRAGFTICVAIENNKHAVETIQKNKKRLKNSKNLEVIDRDIHQVPTKDILDKCGLQVGEVTLVTGGPACQTFSTAGSRTSLSDPRGNLFVQFIRIIDEAQPKFFIMENVKGILSAAIKHRPLNQRGPGFPQLSPEEELGSGFRKILTDLKETGYYVVFGLLNSADFGVPQKRERLIILGSRDGEPIRLPFPTHDQYGYRGKKKWVTLKEGLADLYDPKCEYRPFSEKQIEYLNLIPQGGDWHDLPEDLQSSAIGGAYKSWGGRAGFLRRLAWDKASPALTTNPNGRATMLCHPTETRPLSVREYARLQQFPDSWSFSGEILPHKYMQIGNAVPVGLGKAIGVALIQSMDSRTRSRKRCGLIVCDTPEILDRMSRLRTTFLNPSRMRNDPEGELAEDWFGNSGRSRSDVVDFIRGLGLSDDTKRLRLESHKVVELLHKQYGSPNLNHKSDPLDELIFIKLSVMTSEPSYSRVYERLKEEYSDWAQLLELTATQLAKKLGDAGLGRKKAAKILNILRRIEKDFGAVTLQPLRKMPDRIVEAYLTSLPGIGLKVAKCIMMYSLDRKVLPVDTHVARVSKRVGIIPQDLPVTRHHEELEKVVDPDDRYGYHVNLVRHGRLVCYAKRPHCERCVLISICNYGREIEQLAQEFTENHTRLVSSSI
jgi:DNA (cytosine-5)-methyltransferase 1